MKLNENGSDDIKVRPQQRVRAVRAYKVASCMCTRGVNTFLSGFSPLSATAERNQLPMCSYVLCVWATHSMRCGVYMVAIPYRNGGTLDPGYWGWWDNSAV